MKRITIVLFAALLAGCVTNRPTSQDNVVTRIGFLAEEIMQHPNIAIEISQAVSEQFYLDLGNKPRSIKQIIVVYPVGMKIPSEIQRKIELKGTVRTVVFGGKPGSKSSYKNEVLSLHSWKYLK
jgi:hypothetical protein